MMVLRFRSVGWVAAVATAALGCYLVTQRVAGERRQLASIERDILHGERDAREMEVEIETRGRLSQLERWNSDVLALSAPSPRQYLRREVQLASLDGSAPLPIDRTIAPSPAAARTVAYTPRAATPRADVSPSAEAPQATYAPPLLRHATYVKPAADRLAPHAPAALASADFAADLDAMAASEAKKHRR